MKTWRCKPTLEVLEDRLVPSSIRPTESLSLTFRAPATAPAQITGSYDPVGGVLSLHGGHAAGPSAFGMNEVRFFDGVTLAELTGGTFK